MSEAWINQVFCEDALTGLARIPDGSIDLILTDPPYNLGKDYGNDSDSQTVEEYLRWTEQWIDAALPKLKPNGSLYIFLTWRFSPEIFTRARAKDALKRKQFEKGLEHLSQEGAIQIFHPRGGGMRDPILGAVGALQFEVLQYRLEHEYNALLVLERLPYQVARWVSGDGFDPGKFEQEVDALCVEDRDGNAIALFKSEWNLNYAIGRHPAWTWSPVAPVVPLAKRK